MAKGEEAEEDKAVDEAVNEKVGNITQVVTEGEEERQFMYPQPVYIPIALGPIADQVVTEVESIWVGQEVEPPEADKEIEASEQTDLEVARAAEEVEASDQDDLVEARAAMTVEEINRGRRGGRGSGVKKTFSPRDD